MNYLATITSKRQLTIPSKIFKKAGFSDGDKVVISEEKGSLKIVPTQKLLNELEGSIPVPKKFQNKGIDEIIELAKKDYFSKKSR